MNRCFILTALAFGCFALNSQAENGSYKPCFDEPVFEEPTFATPHFVKPEFIPEKRTVIQFEKPVFEVPIREKAEFEKTVIEKPEFVPVEFDNGCTKPARTPKAKPAPRVNWFSPNMANSKPFVAQKPKSTTTKPAKAIVSTPAAKPKVTKAGSSLLAVSKVR